jgi:hypothetical protein
VTHTLGGIILVICITVACRFGTALRARPIWRWTTDGSVAACEESYRCEEALYVSSFYLALVSRRLMKQWRVFRAFTGKKAAFGIRALTRMSNLAGSHLDEQAQTLSNNVQNYKEESEKEVMEVRSFRFLACSRIWPDFLSHSKQALCTTTTRPIRRRKTTSPSPRIARIRPSNSKTSSRRRASRRRTCLSQRVTTSRRAVDWYSLSYGRVYQCDILLIVSGSSSLIQISYAYNITRSDLRVSSVPPSFPWVCLNGLGERAFAFKPDSQYL